MTVNKHLPKRPVVLYESGDTTTENILMAAACTEGETIIKMASANYMVQDLCFYLQALGVTVEGIGTTTLRVVGVPHIDVDVEYSPSEDPIEAMSLLAAAVVTGSEITIRRVPIEFMEIELALLHEMGMTYEISEEYPSANGLTRLVEVMHALRAGCPWDAEQTHATLVQYLVEECYETVEAIEAGDPAALREELGDLLLQVVFHARIASEAEGFDIDDVARDITDKLVRRHPHVFGDAEYATGEDVEAAWFAMKAAEKGGPRSPRVCRWVCRAWCSLPSCATGRRRAG